MSNKVQTVIRMLEEDFDVNAIADAVESLTVFECMEILNLINSVKAMNRWNDVVTKKRRPDESTH